jgi:hypothetical protein
MPDQLQYFARFERGCEDADPVTIGPFPDFIQLTYNDLRVGPDGDRVAYMNGDHEWKIDLGFAPTPEDAKAWWSDVCVWAEVKR